MKTFAFLLLGLCLTAPALAEEPIEPQLPKERPERHVILMPVVGLWNHAFKETGFSSKLGPVFGFDVVLDPFRWLNVRGGIMQGTQPISFDPGTLSNDATVRQPSLKVLRMHMRVEPVWHYSERTSLYVGLGLGWARMIAEQPVTVPHLTSFERTGVYMGYEGAMGVAYEPIPNWMTLDLSVGASYLASQSGTIFRDGQAFTDDGHRVTLGGLSKFNLGYRMTLGIGIVL